MDITLNQVFNLFMSDRELFAAEKTLLYYRENLTRFIFFVGDINLNEISPDCYNNYVKHLRQVKKYESHPITPASDKNIKNTTIRTYARAVKVFLNWCSSEGYLTQVIKYGKLPCDDSEQVIPLYSDEVDSIDKFFSGKSMTVLRNYCIFHLMLDAGFRSSEVIALRIKDVLFERNALMIDRSKGNKSRVVILCPRLKKYLYQYIYLYRNSACSEESVFIQIKNSDPINSNVIKQLFARLKRKSDIERLHPHLLRHTFATSYIMGGGNIEMLRLLMGHYDYNVTRSYLHLANQLNMLHADIYRLDPIFFKTGY